APARGDCVAEPTVGSPHPIWDRRMKESDRPGRTRRASRPTLRSRSDTLRDCGRDARAPQATRDLSLAVRAGGSRPSLEGSRLSPPKAQGRGPRALRRASKVIGRASKVIGRASRVIGVGGHPKIPPSGQLKIPPPGATTKEGVRARTRRIRDARRGAKGHRGGGTDWPWDSGSDTRDAVAWEVEEGDRAGVGSGHQDGEEVGERGVEAAAPAGTG